LAPPIFLFLVGASIVPAFERRKAAGQSNRLLAKRILRRVVFLLAIGIICDGGIWQHWPNLRFVGAFQRIAICYAVAAWLDLTTGWRLQAGAVAILLLGYWAILAFGHSGDASAYSMEGNSAALVDQLLLPGRKYFGTWDPQGILTIIPAVAVTVAGVLAGKALTTDSGRSIGWSLWLLGAGIAAVNAGVLGDIVVPINPYLGTLTFCLVAIGVASSLLGLLHAALDVGDRNVWALPVVILGRNSLVVVVATAILMNGADLIAKFSALRFQRLFCEHSPAWPLIVLSLMFAIAFALNRFRIYIRA
jgi:predicted acyltransferase